MDDTSQFEGIAKAGQTGGDAVHRALEALTGLAAETREAITAIAQDVRFTAGERIFDEGDVSDLLYVIESGTVLVFRPAKGARTEYPVAELGPGQTLGELALIDGAPRSLSARAETDCRLTILDPADLRRLPNGERLLADLKGSLGVTIVRRTRESTDRHVKALESDLERAREQQLFGRFFLYSLAMMSIGAVVNDIIARNVVDIDIYTDSFLWIYLTILLIPSYLIVRHMGIPWEELGVTKHGLRRSLTEGAVLSVGFFAVTMGLATTLRALDMLPGNPIPFEPADWLGIIPYVAHSFLQELVGRGLLLSSFRRFLNDQRGVQSNLLAAMLFSLFHLHFGLIAVGLTFVSSILFGALYLRHRNLAGVTLLHSVAGVTAFTAGLM